VNEALGSLVVAAALVGTPTPPPVPTPRAARGRNAAGETVLARAPLAGLAAAQARGARTYAFGGAPLEAAVAFDANGEDWLVLRQGAWRGAYPYSALAAGAAADLPSGRASLKADHGKIALAAASGETLTLSERELLDALYAAATKFELGPVTYAALWHDGRGGTPAALDLMRRDAQGDYFITYRAPAQMKGPTQWVMATNGLIYGMRIEGLELVFVDKPLPTATKRP